MMLVIGVWVMSIKKPYQAINDVLTSPATMTIVVSIMMLLTAAIGVVGSTKDKLMLLRVFMTIVIVVFIIQVAIGIIAFIFREETISAVSEQMKSALEQYVDDPVIRTVVDKIQSTHKCCGLQDVNDWNGNRNFTCHNIFSRLSCSVPDSCCTDPEEVNCGLGVRSNTTLMEQKRIHTQGCTFRLLLWIENKLDIVGAISLGFAILHVIGLFFVYMLAVKVEDRERLYKYRARYYNNAT
jgi:hypothetical protein